MRMNYELWKVKPLIFGLQVGLLAKISGSSFSYPQHILILEISYY